MTKNHAGAFRIIAFMLLISVLVMGSASAYITDYNWTNPERRSYYDTYYDKYVTAYEGGTTAVLTVTVNGRWTSSGYANYTVKVKMDWATENATSTETDYQIAYGDTHTFKVEIEISNTTSNIYPHGYTIYSLYREALNDSLATDEVEKYNDLVVYSSEQSEAMQLKTKLDRYPPLYYYGAFIPILTSSEARELITNATIYESMADESYARGDFVGARDNYAAALDYTIEAFAADTGHLTSFEDAVQKLVNAGQSYLSFQGWAFLLAALGFLLIGVGIVVYLVRKSKP